MTSYGGLVFISGVGAHFEGDITAHTKHVLDEIQKKLEDAGSSMEKVLKVNVYLNDLKDYKAMNEAFLGRFGPEPPVRTTIAAAGGIPGNSLVEIDCIATCRGCRSAMRQPVAVLAGRHWRVLLSALPGAETATGHPRAPTSSSSSPTTSATPSSAATDSRRSARPRSTASPPRACASRSTTRGTPSARPRAASC